MVRVKEVIVVEGRYDRNTVSQVVDAHIVETAGFGIFSNREKLALLRALAEKRGLIILMDSDSAGFLIRGKLKSSLPSGSIKHAYIPEIAGKEHRKRHASKEGILGVEGMSPDIILEALRRCGATMDSAPLPDKAGMITKTDLYSFRLSGASGAAGRRAQLMKKLGLPEKLSSNALLDVLNALFTLEELRALIS